MQDTRCCGTGTCLIDVKGRCWCGQQWDGEKMCRPEQTPNLTKAEGSVIDAVDAGDETKSG